MGIHRTVSCATDPSLKFPSQKFACDPKKRIRFANIRSVRSVVRTLDESEMIELRVVRGILNVGRGWKELQWEAVCRLHGTDGYSCDAILIVSRTWEWLFTRKQLRRTAEKFRANAGLTPAEYVALFMDGCLASFAENHARVIATDMPFVPPIHRYGK